MLNAIMKNLQDDIIHGFRFSAVLSRIIIIIKEMVVMGCGVFAVMRKKKMAKLINEKKKFGK